MKSVLIAGGGIIGLSAAWRLAQAGCAVTLCDQSRVGAEASWAAAGMLAPGGEFGVASEEAQLACESRALYGAFVRELEAASGEAVDYSECGALELAFSDEELAHLEAKAARQAEFGIQSKPVTAKHAAVFWPRLNARRMAGGRFYPNDAVVDPRDLTRALAVACRRQGVSIVENCGVARMRVQRDSIEVTCRAGASQYDAAVIAAGAWSSRIPVDGVPALPESEPVKGQLIGYAQPAQTCPTILRQSHRYMIQRVNGMLIVGASMERSGFDQSLSESVKGELAAWAGTVLPHLAETSPTESWTGLRPASDRLRVEHWHSDRLLLAYGHFRNGILLAPLTAARITGLNRCLNW